MHLSDHKMTSNLDLLKINKFVLRKQELATELPNRNIVETVRAAGGLHATSATTPYLFLFARVTGFKREHLDRELYAKRNLGKIFLFEDNTADLLKEILGKAKSLGAFISGQDVDVKECEYMVPLMQRSAGGVRSPLKGCRLAR